MSEPFSPEEEQKEREAKREQLIRDVLQDGGFTYCTSAKAGDIIGGQKDGWQKNEYALLLHSAQLDKKIY